MGHVETPATIVLLTGLSNVEAKLVMCHPVIGFVWIFKGKFVLGHQVFLTNSGEIFVEIWSTFEFIKKHDNVQNN